jgi:hypothetical protein
MFGVKIVLPELSVLLVVMVVIVLTYVKIFQKAGRSGWPAILSSRFFSDSSCC